ALQEKLPGAPTVKPEHLGTLHTLRDVAAFLAGGAAPTVESPKPEPVVARPLSQQSVELQRSVVRAAPLDRAETRTGRPIPQGGVAWVVAEPSALANGLVERLRTQGLGPQVFDWSATVPIEAGHPAVLVLLAPRTATSDLVPAAFRWLRSAAAGL